MRIISVPAKNSAFAALESMIDAHLSLDGKGQVPFVLLLLESEVLPGIKSACSGLTAKSELFTNILVVDETPDGRH